MRIAAILLLLLAAPKNEGIEFVGTSDKAVEIARTRGKMIFLTVIVDHDQQNRAVIESVFHDRKLRKTLTEFVCLYANPEDDHGTVRVQNKRTKKTEHRCADAPALICQQHQHLAQHYSRGFYGDKAVRTPLHFVLDAEEEVLDTIFNGDFESGMNAVSAEVLENRLQTLLKKHGKGLTETQYKKMQEDLSRARAARARNKTVLELKALMAVVALRKNVVGVRQARKRLAEIEKIALTLFDAAVVLAQEKKWEEALDALDEIPKAFPGTMTAAKAEKERDNLRGYAAVKRMIKARDLYEHGIAFRDRNKPDQARKRFAQCARRYPDTKYGKLAAEALEKLPPPAR